MKIKVRASMGFATSAMVIGTDLQVGSNIMPSMAASDQAKAHAPHMVILAH